MPSTTLRLFIACYPPEPTSRALLALLKSSSPPAHRATPAAQIHMTLQFIGDTPAREVDDVVESLTRAASGIDRFSLQPQRLITLPAGRDPRLIAITTDAPPGLLELHRRLVTRLARRLKKRDRFLPHMTLARLHADIHADPIDEPVVCDSFAVDRIRLMRSVLKPEGAEHVELAAVSIG